MKEKHHPSQTFRIGIAMAGAVSAGAYTAGVIDYLLEALERWERAKAQNRAFGPDHPDYDETIPMHDVVIEVIGGASAGGMTAAITSLALFEGMRPVNDNNSAPEENKLYDAWVNLNDSREGSTLQQMLQNDDIVGNKVPSLLNSSPIDAIADRAKEIDIKRDIYSQDWPAYISKDLELILTICSLRGIPIEIDFGPSEETVPTSAKAPGETYEEKAAHKMHLHKGIAHFTINPVRAQLDHLLRLNPRIADDKTAVIEAAKATGAFPVGLRPRKFQQISHSYLRGQIQRMFGHELNVRWGSIPKPFSFLAIDGGTINNEPFEEVLKVLEERYESSRESETENEPAFKNFAILMIDPFPNFEEPEEPTDYEEPESVQETVPHILSAIRRQAMIKESELSRGFTGDHTRAMVFPVRREEVQEEGQTVRRRMPYPIACGALDGFGGFFSRSFREHDFHLGRKNCQAFLRKHFSMREDKVFAKDENGEVSVSCPPFAGWKSETPMYWRFHYVKNGQPHFPIIPDLRIEHAMSDDPKQNGTLEAPPFPSIDIEELQALKKPMRRRVRKVLLSIIKGSFSSEKETPSPAKKSEKAFQKEVKRTVNRYLGDGLAGRILLFFTLFLLLLPVVVMLPILIILGLLGSYLIVSSVTKQIFRSIVSDFKKRGLLRE